MITSTADYEEQRTQARHRLMSSCEGSAQDHEKALLDFMRLHPEAMDGLALDTIAEIRQVLESL